MNTEPSDPPISAAWDDVPDDPPTPTTDPTGYRDWWAKNLRILGEARRDAERIAADADAERGRIMSLVVDELADVDSWESDRISGPLRRIEHLERVLTETATAYRQANPEQTWSIDLPAGRVLTRYARPKITVTDPGLFLAWALGAPLPDPGTPAEEVWENILAASELVTEFHRVPAPAPALSVIRDRLALAETGAVVEPGTGETVPGLAPDDGKITVNIEPKESRR
jgi:hypothetical protein